MFSPASVGLHRPTSAAARYGTPIRYLSPLAYADLAFTDEPTDTWCTMTPRAVVPSLPQFISSPTWPIVHATPTASNYWPAANLTFVSQSTPTNWSIHTVQSATTNPSCTLMATPTTALTIPFYAVASYRSAAAGLPGNLIAALITANAVANYFNVEIDQNAAFGTAVLDALRSVRKSLRPAAGRTPSQQASRLGVMSRKLWQRRLRRLELTILVGKRRHSAPAQAAVHHLSDMPTYTMAMIAVYLRHGRRHEPADDRSLPASSSNPMGRMASVS